MRLLFTLIVSLITAGAASLLEARSAAAHEHEHAHAAMHVVDVTANPSPGGRMITAAYMTIHNPGDEDDRLVSATSPLAGRVELHRTSHAPDGTMRMEQQTEGVVIPAGEHVLFQRGGLHVMVMDLARPLAEGDELPLTLVFEHAGAIEVTASVVRPGARPSGDHANH